MTVYRPSAFRTAVVRPFVEQAQEIVQSFDFDTTVITGHFQQRVSERRIKADKISEKRFRKGYIFEIKVENGCLSRIGISFAYSKKVKICMVIGLNSKNAAVLTAWLREE